MVSIFIQRSDSTKYKMLKNNVIVFVCEHGAAKSILAAAYYNKFASEKNLGISAVARGTNPDAKLSPQTMEGLRADGLMPTESAPHKLTLADVESAERIISFCELPEEYHGTVIIEQWNDVPPVSEDYEKARNVMITKLEELLKNNQPNKKELP